MSDCQGRCLTCVYQGKLHTGDRARPSCAYLLLTGHSRVKAAYKRLHVTEMTDEVREALKPANCRQFKKGDPMRDDKEHRVAVISSDPERALATELRIRAKAAQKKEAERERILQKQKRSYTKPERPPTVDPKKARELYDQGMTDGQIAQALGIGKGSVWYWRKMNGLKPVVQERPEPPRFGELYNRGMTDQQIAETTGQSQRAVQRWRYKNHLRANRKGPAPNLDLEARRRKMRELYDQGMNDAEIAEALGMSVKTTAKYRRQCGLLPHMQERQCKINAARALKLWKQGKSDKEIGVALGVSKGCVWHWRHRAGLPSVEIKQKPREISWEETGKRLLEQGATDREIAETVGKAVSTITCWRVKHGLDYPGRKKKKKADHG